MASTRSNAYSIALESFVFNLKREEDIRSPFYKEVLSQLGNLLLQDSQSTNNSGPEELALFIKELDRKQKCSSLTRRISERLDPLVAGLSQYTQACDVIIQAGPAGATLLYGGARIVLQLAEKFRKCFEDVVSMMESIGGRLKCYQVFAKAYETSADMQQLLVETYKNIITFWQKAATLLSRKPFKTLLKGVVKPLDAEWQRLKQTLEEDAKKIQMFAQATEADITRVKERSKTASQQAKLRIQVVEWIKSTDDADRLDVRQDIRANLESRHNGTCEWLFRQPDMVEWLNTKKTTSIWYTAGPGAGKTILASALTRRLYEQGYRAATFFCSFNDLIRRKPINLLRSLALQLLEPSDPIPGRVKRLYEDDLKHHCSKLADIQTAAEVVKALLEQQSRVHVIVDGLDECDDRDLLLASFRRILVAKTYGIVKWFFSSRPDSDIRPTMRNHNVRELRADPERILDDVRKYVADRFLTSMDHDCDGCIDYWTDKSEGCFLWIRYMLDILEGEGTTCSDEIEEELEKFPRGLIGCYTRTLSRLATRSDRDQRLAQSIFTLLVGAIQPLRLSEIRHALATKRGLADFSEGSLPKLGLVEELCSNLVVFDRTMKGTEGDPMLKVAHKSVQDFFIQDPDTLQLHEEHLRSYFVTPAKVNLELGLASLSYLSYRRYKAPQNITLVMESNDHSFLRHAATFWHQYLGNIEPSADVYGKVLDFIRSEAFWSCIDVQCHTAPYLFARYTKTLSGGYNIESTGPKSLAGCAEDVCFSIPLPGWLDAQGPDSEAARILQAFHSFVNEWHPVLNSHPKALDQCRMGTEWNQLLPGRVLWQDNRVQTLDFTNSEVSQSTITDIEAVDNSLQIRLSVLDLSSEAATTECSHPLNEAPLDFPVTRSMVATWENLGPGQLPPTMSNLDEGHWNVDFKRLTAVYSPATDVATYAKPSAFHPPDRIKRRWEMLCQSTNMKGSSEAKAYHCVEEQLFPHDTSATQLTGDSGYGSMISVVPSDCEDSDSDTESSAESKEDCARHHCLLMVTGHNAPRWHFWQSKYKSEVGCAFHPTEDIAVWSATAHELCIMRLAPGTVETSILPEPVDVEFGEANAVRKAFQFSPSGDILHYLLHMITKSALGYKHSISLSSFSYCSSQDAGCVLERTRLDLYFTYESASALQSPFSLIYWDCSHVYIALPPLSANTKIFRMRLFSEGIPSTFPDDEIETLCEPVYFPYSTLYRRPLLMYCTRDTNKNFLILGLGAEYSSASMMTAGSSNPPMVMTWDIHPHKGWRGWDNAIDLRDGGASANGATYDLLRGSFLDRDRRFEVTVRSGLDWRRKAFLSCA